MPVQKVDPTACLAQVVQCRVQPLMLNRVLPLPLAVLCSVVLCAGLLLGLAAVFVLAGSAVAAAQAGEIFERGVLQLMNVWEHAYHSYWTSRTQLD